MQKAMSLKDVTQSLKVQAYRVQYAIIHGLVPEPQLRIGGRRVYTPADVRRLAQHFKISLPAANAAAEPARA
jgi:DNA-binding transcriptional MerR regulator